MTTTLAQTTRFLDAAVLATSEISADAHFRYRAIQNLATFIEQARRASTFVPGLADASDADIQAFVTTLVRLAAQDTDENPVEAAMEHLPVSVTDEEAAYHARRVFIASYYRGLMDVAITLTLSGCAPSPPNASATRFADEPPSRGSFTLDAPPRRRARGYAQRPECRQRSRAPAWGRAAQGSGRPLARPSDAPASTRAPHPTGR